MRRTPASGLVLIRPAVSVGVTGEQVVAKEGKTARELVALVKNELHIKEVELEVYGHRHLGWYATALPGRRSAASVQPDVERIVERLRRLYDLI